MTIEEEEILSESTKYKKSDFLKKEELKDMYLQNKEEFIIKYSYFEFLLLDVFEGNKILLKALKDNLLEIFKREEKYSFDLVVSYLVNNGVEFEEGIKLLLKDNKKLSFVTRERLFSLEEKEISSCKDDKVFDNTFMIIDIAEDIEIDKITKKTKND